MTPLPEGAPVDPLVWSKLPNQAGWTERCDRCGARRPESVTKMCYPVEGDRSS
jgi:hypothetical protein